MMPRKPLCHRRTITGLIIILAVLPVFLTACFSGTQDKPSADEKATAEKANGMGTFQLSQLTVPHDAAYSSILEDFDKNDLQNIDRALLIFSNTRSDSLSRDSMLITFNAFITSAMQEYYDTKLLGNRELIAHFKNKKDPEAQKLRTSLSSHGINLIFRDGDFYLEPDNSFIYSHLDRVLTSGSRDYLQTKISITKGFNTDENRQISLPDSLAQQVIAWEDLMLKNPGYLLNDEIQAQYLDVLVAYLSGMEEAPLFDPDTKMLDPEYQSSYLRYIEEHPNRESTKIVKKYYDLLASKGFKYSEEFDSFLSEINFNPAQNSQ